MTRIIGILLIGSATFFGVSVLSHPVGFLLVLIGGVLLGASTGTTEAPRKPKRSEAKPFWWGEQ